MQERAGLSAFEALGLSLSPALSLSDLTMLRLWILGGGENLSQLIALAAARDLLPALEYGLSRHGLVPPESRTTDGRTPAAFLREVRASHAARRAAMRAHLVAAVAALNGAGIEPLLLKGCVSLWTGAAPWRQMRDLDILVREDRAEAARTALAAIGFHNAADAESLTFGHHLPPMIRADMPGWLELHFRASDRKAERHLPTAALWRAARPSSCAGAVAHVLPAPEHVLHGLVHNHFGHRMSAFGTLNLKGLHEFAWGVAGMEPEEARTLDALSRGDARMRAAFEFWAAAAADLLRLPLPDAWVIGAAARRRARATIHRAAAGVHESLVETFVRSAAETGDAAGRQASWVARLRSRLHALRAATREIVVPWRDRDALRDKSAGIRR